MYPLYPENFEGTRVIVSSTRIRTRNLFGPKGEPIPLGHSDGIRPHFFLFLFNTIFVSSHMYPVNPEGTQVIVGSMNMGYISDTARNRTHNLFRPKREPIPLCHCDPLTSSGLIKPEEGQDLIYFFLNWLEFCWNCP